MSATRDLLLVGAGGFAREAAAAVAASCATAAGDPAWNLLGHLDDDPARHGTTVGPSRVLGPSDAVHDHPDAAVVVCTGNPADYDSRRRIVERLGLSTDRYGTIVHPAASIGAGTRLGAGTVVLAGTVTTVDVTIGDHVAVMPACVLTHDDVVGDFATLASGVRLAGGAIIDAGAYLGAGCLVDGVRIGARSLVGMGAVVRHDVPADEVWAGIPARRLRSTLTASNGSAR